MSEIGIGLGSSHIRHGSNIGQPLTRREGVLKVTGAARYAADNHPDGLVHMAVVRATMPRARVVFVLIALGVRSFLDRASLTNPPGGKEPPNQEEEAREKALEQKRAARAERLKRAEVAEKKAVPATLSSAQYNTGCGTGKPSAASARITRYSRSTACAEGSNLPGGLRRKT